MLIGLKKKLWFKMPKKKKKKPAKRKIMEIGSPEWVKKETDIFKNQEK